MGVLALSELTSCKLVDAEKDIVPPRLEELSKEESQPKQQESPVQQSLLPRDPEQAPQLLMVQLSLLRTETER